MPRITIIIPTYNRLARLKQVLVALEAQDYPHDQFNVVIISDGSTDGTDAFFQHLSTKLDLIFATQVNQGPAAARNHGLRQANGEYILFIDDDVLPIPGLITEHMRLHATQANLVVLGPMLTPNDFTLSPWVAWEQAMLDKQYAAMQKKRWAPSARQFYTGNTSVARKYLLAVGGFDERFRRAEDVELAYRLAKLDLHFVFNPQAIGYHYAERSYQSWLKTPYVYGRNDVIFAREHELPILKAMQEEFEMRNRLTQILVWACLDRPRLSQWAEGLIKALSNQFGGLGKGRLARVCYSAIFNLRYYQGVADEMGNRRRIFAKQG